MNEEGLVRTGVAARLLGRSSEAVRQYADRGRLPAVKTEDGCRLYRLADVRALAAELQERSGR